MFAKAGQTAEQIGWIYFEEARWFLIPRATQGTAKIFI